MVRGKSTPAAAGVLGAKRLLENIRHRFLHAYRPTLIDAHTEPAVARIKRSAVQTAHIGGNLVSRRSMHGARDDRLFFAQVREDPLLETEALSPLSGKTVAVVGSGGCTALSLIAAGAGRVVAIDLNRTQNHLVELKAAVVSRLSSTEANSFLGGAPAEKSWRRETYGGLRASLSPSTRDYWDAHPRAVSHGVIGSGVSEELLRLIRAAITMLVHSRRHCSQLLARKTLEEQATFYRDVWNTWRWRLMFTLVCNRLIFNRAYRPGFFRSLHEPSFAAHFRKSVAHGLTAVPVSNNYFLHQMLTGFFPTSAADGVPPYLSPDAAPQMRTMGGRLQIVDASFTDYLKSCPDSSIDGYCLSNICEWLTRQQIDALFSEIARTAAPGARLCFRNFLGWTEVPKRFRGAVVEDRAMGERLTRRDRSLMQLRFAVCRIEKASNRARKRPIRSFVLTRDARPGDNAGLLALGALCPMEGDIGMYLDRSPDFFALSRLEGSSWQVGVAEDSGKNITGCISAAMRHSYLRGCPSATAYVGDLKVAPAHRDLRTADALMAYAMDFCNRRGASDIPFLATVLVGNRAMEYRARGFRGMPRLKQFATIRSHAISLLWRRAASNTDDFSIARANAADLEEMTDLWRRVAPTRQFTPVFTAESLAQWIAQAPSLRIENYWLARGRDGRLAGFFALWDQTSFKTTRVTHYSRRLATIRAAVNLAAPVLGAATLPQVGEPLAYLTVAHVCVPQETPGVLRALLLQAYNESRCGKHSFITIGLDIRDPLCAALRGLMAIPTDFGAYVSTPRGVYAGVSLDDRPLHFEIALA